MSSLHINEIGILVDYYFETIIGVGQFDTDGEIDLIDFIIR